MTVVSRSVDRKTRRLESYTGDKSSDRVLSPIDDVEVDRVGVRSGRRSYLTSRSPGRIGGKMSRKESME